MENRKANSFTASEALAMYSRGERLACPVCGVTLASVPEVLEPGMRPIGLKCPTDLHHFLIHGEPTDAMKAVRERMKNMVTDDPSRKR
jgi:hypothetical protein